MNLLIGIFASLLPERWREWWDEEAVCGQISGYAEFLVCLLVLFARYVAIIDDRAGAMGRFGLAVAEKRGEAGIMTFGLIAAFEFLLHWQTLLLAYFCVEGFWRALDSALLQRCLPTAPLWLLDRAAQRCKRKRPTLRPGAIAKGQTYS